MAKLTFSQRYRKDNAFRAAVEDVVREAILESAGIDPESLNDAYESGVSPLTLTSFRAFSGDKKKAGRGRAKE